MELSSNYTPSQSPVFSDQPVRGWEQRVMVAYHGRTEDQWRPVLGWPYEVSDTGRVRCPAGELRPHWAGRGYLQVTLKCDGARKLAYVHALVAAAFIGPRPEGHGINHKDGSKTNNCPENLEYVTPKQNTRHAIEIGLFLQGERHQNAKYPDEMILAIRREPPSMSLRELSLKYGMSKQQAWAYRTGKSRRSAGGLRVPVTVELLDDMPLDLMER